MKISKNLFEKIAWNKNKYVCGIDEVGRGCLAGPVVTTACIIPINTTNKILRDSKLMTEEQRNEAFLWIKNNCFYSISILDHNSIDQLNIYQATKIAMQKSLLQLIHVMPFDINKIEYILTDAMPISWPLKTNPNINIESFPKGETYSTSIAAASIVAKVFRDNLMKKLQNCFPMFKFQENKGYGTSQHVNIIKKEGISIIHRNSFLNKIPTPNKIKEKQACLF
jgi:ribonuclease HII